MAAAAAVAGFVVYADAGDEVGAQWGRIPYERGKTTGGKYVHEHCEEDDHGDDDREGNWGPKWFHWRRQQRAMETVSYGARHCAIRCERDPRRAQYRSDKDMKSISRVFTEKRRPMESERNAARANHEDQESHRGDRKEAKKIES